MISKVATDGACLQFATPRIWASPQGFVHLFLMTNPGRGAVGPQRRGERSGE